jgi:hypothetical protein
MRDASLADFLPVVMSKSPYDQGAALTTLFPLTMVEVHDNPTAGGSMLAEDAEKPGRQPGFLHSSITSCPKPEPVSSYPSF